MIGPEGGLILPFQKTHGKSRTADGGHTALYGRWANMKDRCHNPKSKDYHRYGARGITVCDEWRNDYEAFHTWALTNGYKPGLQIDRKDNDKGYFPDNCRWITPKGNSNNRRNSITVLYKGQEITIIDLSKSVNIPWQTLYKHYQAGDLLKYIEGRRKGDIRGRHPKRD